MRFPIRIVRCPETAAPGGFNHLPGRSEICSRHPVYGSAVPFHAAKPGVLPLRELANGGIEPLEQVVTTADLAFEEFRDKTIFKSQPFEPFPRHAARVQRLDLLNHAILKPFPETQTDPLP